MSDSVIQAHIRWMIRRDMPEVLAIENEAFEFPWSEDDFVRCLRLRNCIGMVSEINDQVSGLMVYALNKESIDLLDFAVERSHRRKKIGSQMIDKLTSKLSQQKRRRVQLHIRETNLAAQLFFKGQGFNAIDTVRNYFEETDEDAYLMEFNKFDRYQLPSHSQQQSDNSTQTDYRIEPDYADPDAYLDSDPESDYSIEPDYSTQPDPEPQPNREPQKKIDIRKQYPFLYNRIKNYLE